MADEPTTDAGNTEIGNVRDLRHVQKALAISPMHRQNTYHLVGSAIECPSFKREAAQFNTSLSRMVREASQRVIARRPDVDHVG